MLGWLLVPEFFEHNTSSAKVNASKSTGGMHRSLLFPSVKWNGLKAFILEKKNTLKGKDCQVYNSQINLVWASTCNATEIRATGSTDRVRKTRHTVTQPDKHNMTGKIKSRSLQPRKII